jgi:NADH-quinone oxidoreductase subunit H
MLRYIFYYLIFPGFFFLAAAGMLVSWIDRKLTARLQWRMGPPFFQPFYDLRKLFEKETILPQGGNTMVFILAPVLMLLAIVLVSNMLLLPVLLPGTGFTGDFIVILYLFTLPPLASILGASSSHNPMASLGASREMKSVLSYELPFVLAMLVPLVKAGAVSLGAVIALQQRQGSFIFSASGILALLVAVVCLQAKLGLAPFDYAEAETELSAGSLIEYSGPLLALWKLGKMMLMIIGPLLLIITFWGGGNPAFIAAKYVPFLLIAIVARNTNPRLRIDQAVRFFWSIMFTLSIAALLLAVLGY